MASRAAPNSQLQQQDMHQKVEVKKKKTLPTDGRNRRVLGDIGNVVKVPALAAADGKNRPITRNFKNPSKKSTTSDVYPKQGGLETQVLAGSLENVTLKETKAVAAAVASEHVTLDRVTRRKVTKSLTAALTARSKAACGLVRTPQILNIDQADSHNELAQVEYVEDIYNFYKATEEENRVVDYMHLQPEINARMRSILVDWLIEVHNKFELMPETLYLTLNIVDRYLSMKVVARRELQLVGISSMLIACKYEEIWAPEVKDFICISDNAYTREQILSMEKSILGKLEWYLTVPTPYVFLVRYIKASVPADKLMENMAFFLAELGMVDYKVSIASPPSLIAASAVYAARKVLGKTPAWTDTLKHHTGYDEDQLKECGKVLISFSKVAAEGKLKASFKKYSQAERYSVAALLSPGAGETTVSERQG